MKQSKLLDQIDEVAISAAIRQAEFGCSGEMRVHVEPTLRKREIRDVAERTFERLGMTRTAERNGVLLFIAAEEQQFAILGDRGINEKVGPDFWEEIAAQLTRRFQAGEFTAGIVEAIGAAASQLGCHFPRTSQDVDELSNEISFGERDRADPKTPH